jgi:hypothetical protein
LGPPTPHEEPTLIWTGACTVIAGYFPQCIFPKRSLELL